MSQSIQPLRISKTTSSSSPSKMGVASTHRPLAELGPMERRRNSPSYNQSTRKPIFQKESSPLDSSPVASNSPRLYWQSRDPGSPTRSNVENRSPLGDRDHSPSPVKRSSIENLKRASRVKNSNMFAREHKHEYDPASSPMIDRPLAAGRPLSIQAQENAYGGKRPEGFRKNIAGESKSSPTKLSTKMNEHVDIFTSPVKTQGSPTKSSLSSKSRYAQAHGFDPENSIWSDEEDSVVERQLPPGKSLHRHAKSVTFDAAPPQVNEYEMTTPDPSSVASGSRDGSHDSTEDESFDRGSSIDREDSFDASLEDTEKTPVVLPEDWRFMSPDMANDDLATHIEDPFDGDCSSPAPTARPSSSVDTRPSSNRTGSASSDGEKRPLPPLPGPNMPIMSHAEINSADSQSVIAESVAQVPIRAASPPRPASITKSEIKGMGGCSMSIEDRLRLMMIQDEETPKVADAEQREQRDRTLDRQSPALKPEFLQFNQEFEFKEDVVEDDDPTSFGNYKLPPRISRESILRKLKTRTPNVETEEDECSSLSLSSGIDACPCEDIDPDMPLPTTEVDVVESEVLIKQEATNEDSPVDVYSIPDLYSQHLQAESYTNAIEKLEAFQLAREAESTKDDDDESRYSVDSQIVDFQDCVGSHETENGAASTPRPSNPDSAGKQLQTKENNRMSLPQFAALLGDQDFGFGMESFMAPSPTTNMEPVKSAMPVESSWTPSPPLNHDQSNEMLLPMVDPEELALERPMTPDEQLQPPRFPGHGPDVEEEPRTPDSVIRHSVASSPAPESPGIPEPVATIKASGSRLKTRPSATPADIKAMAEVRRQVSSEIPSVPQVPQRHQNRPSVVAEASEIFIDPNDESASLNDSEEKDFAKHLKRKSSLVTLDLSVEDSNGLGIESEFDRVIEAQKVAFHSLYFATASQSRSPIHAENAPGESFKPFRENFADTIFRTQKGYLMRQNTKVIIASSASHESAESTAETKDRQEPSTRATRSAGTSPRKPSQSTWTTEPWNGKIRRKSIRQSGGSPSKKSAGGPAPPLPGQESNVASGLGSVNEDEVGLNIDDIGEDGERGRLFVKVVRVKDLDLPLPKGERSYFALTLDNGMHCVTTAWLELGRTAPIGQEFELVVLNDLEFQLTLQTKLEEPKAKPIIESPSKAVKVQKPSTFSRVFASPRKRKELELKQQEEAQRAERQSQKEAQAGRRSAQPTAWELLNKLVAKDGSFARSYVSLKDHESNAFGNSYTVDVPCFNEWATEDVNASVKSKRSVNNGGTQRKAPYRVGKLELQLLYIPKPKGVKDEDMPKSMNACIRELKEAESASPLKWEGHLSQQGGDCPYWRRRFFTLDGSKFTAYHEATRQPRATINLAKASKLIDDKSALMRKETNGKGGRRKSAFAEEEEGYMFVEEGFRMRFANGETIDFYADSAAEKDGWMKALSEVVGKDLAKPRSWTDVVLARHRTTASTAKQIQQGPTRTPAAKTAPPPRSAPPTPAKTFTPRPAPPPMPEKSPRRSDFAQRRSDANKTRSMIF